MKTETEKLVAEMLTLRTVIAAHEEKVSAAAAAWDEACEFAAIPTKYGRYTVDLKTESWRYPSVEAASKVYDALREDRGYFWACSRLRDLEAMLGAGWSPQLPLRYEADPMGNYVPFYGGHMPAAHECVKEFVARYA